MDSSSAIDVLRDARNGSRVTYRIGGGTRGQTGLPAHFRQTAPEIHGSLVCPQPVLLFVVVVGAGGFADDVVYHFRGAGGIQIGGHAAQGDTEHIAVMQFRSETAGAEFEPEAVHQIDVFGPKSRGMGAQVEEHHVLLVFEHEFERKGGTRFGEFLPILADLRALFGRRQFGREAHHDARGLQVGGGLHDGVIGVGAGDHHQLDVFAGLFRQGDDFGEDLGLGIGEHLVRLQAELAGAGPEGAHGEHHDVDLAGVGLEQDAVQVLQAVGIAHGDQDVAGTHVDGLLGNFRGRFQAEFFGFLSLVLMAAAVVDFGALEDDEEGDGESDSRDGGHLLGEHVDDGEREQREGNEDQPNRQFELADHEIQRRLPEAIFGGFVAQDKNREGLHGEAPHHTEGVGFAQHDYVAAGEQDGEQLEADDGIDEARGGAEAVMRVAEPIGQDAILGDAVEHPVGADNGGIDRAREQQHAHQHDHSVEGQAQGQGAEQVHGKAADQAVQELGAGGLGDDHHREKGNQRGEEHAVGEDDPTGAFQVLELGVGDFAVDLGEGFEAAHGEEGVAQADHDGEDGDGGRHGAFEPAHGIVGEAESMQGGKGHRLIAVLQDGGDAPDDEDDHHGAGDLHDPQSLLAGFMHADNVLAPEVEGNPGGEDGGEIRRVNVQSGQVQVLAEVIDEAAEVEARADGTDGAGEHVIEHRSGHGELGERPAHSLVDHAVDAAAHEHGAALDVDGAHGVGEQHDRQDEPGSGFADGGFGDAADVEGAGGKVAEHDSGGAPEGNEGQHDRGGDDDLHGG